MEKQELLFIQDQIGYNFKNIELLQQAFVRRSYSQENGGENNEVLEFIGDKVLDVAVVKLFSDKYGHITVNADFACEFDENKLTEMKRKLVRKEMLAQRIDILGLANFLIMGNGDIQNNISEVNSVKEDLFEAILGAVALDCFWNMDEIFETVEIMLEPEQYLSDDRDENYVELIQEWTLWKNERVPLYHFVKASYQSTWYSPFEGITQKFPIIGSWEKENIQYHCLLNISADLPIFRGFGSSKSIARKAVCELAYQYLEKHNLLFSIRDEIKNPNKNDSINQLEILARRGYFSIPVYNYRESYDVDGNPIWRCICSITEIEKDFSAIGSSKKEAKKDVAYKMLKFVLDLEPV